MTQSSPAQPETLPKLTDKQRRFVDAYCGEARFNATKAARLAGYSEKSAYQKGYELKNVESIRAHIDAYLNTDSMTTTEILHELTDVARRSLDDCIEIRTYGDDVSAKMDANAKMKALELLGKAHQLFTDKQQIEMDGGLRVEIVGMADEELP